jgi:hypothetical protein
MSNLLNALNTKKSSNSANRQTFQLTEVVGILNMIGNGATIADLVKATGRSKHSLNYKFYEGPIQVRKEINGEEVVETQIRSLRRFATMEELYAHYGQKWSQEDQDLRIEQFNAEVEKRLTGEVAS